MFVNLTWTPLRRATSAAAEADRTRQRTAALARDPAVQDVWLAVRDAVRAQRSAALRVEIEVRPRP